MRNLVDYGSISPEGARVLGVIGASRCNLVISGGTGSGKTTLLNTMTAFIDRPGRVITCEDAAELQLQQPWSGWGRPAQGQGEITMLIWSRTACGCARSDHVGEVRDRKPSTCCGPANTVTVVDGHPAPTPRARRWAGSDRGHRAAAAPVQDIPRDGVGSMDVIIQAARARRFAPHHHITEVLGLRRRRVITQDLFVFEITGEDAQGRVVGKFRSTGISAPILGPRALLWVRAQARRSADGQVARTSDPRRLLGWPWRVLRLRPGGGARGQTGAGDHRRSPRAGRRRERGADPVARRNDPQGPRPRAQRKASDLAARLRRPGCRSPRTFWIVSAVLGVVVPGLGGRRQAWCRLGRQRGLGLPAGWSASCAAPEVRRSFPTPISTGHQVGRSSAQIIGRKARTLASRFAAGRGVSTA